MPNPQTPSPVVSENAKKNVIRTGGANEIDIDDSEDEQRVKISTPYGQSVLQIGAPNAAETGTFVGTPSYASHACVSVDTQMIAIRAPSRCYARSVGTGPTVSWR